MVVGIGFCTAILLIILIYLGYRMRDQEVRILEDKNEWLEKENKNLIHNRKGYEDFYINQIIQLEDDVDRLTNIIKRVSEDFNINKYCEVTTGKSFDKLVQELNTEEPKEMRLIKEYLF